MDATCYESYIRFPTDVKLLWECCQWVFEKQLFKICRKAGIKRPRYKYHEQKKSQLFYAREGRKNFKETRKSIKSLIYLLDMGLEQLQEIISELGADTIYTTNSKRWYCTGTKIFPCFPKKGPK